MTRPAGRAPQEIFHLEGRTVAPDGTPLSRLQMVVVDEDPLRDDLIGAGITRPDGSFQISFCRSEFNQDLGERERLPDIQLVFSDDIDGKRQAYFRRSFPGLRFLGGREDLGAIVVDTWRERLEPLPGVDPIPGGSKNVRRLRIDEPLLRHCVDEVSPRVESITGWPALADGLTLRIARRTKGRDDPLGERIIDGLAHRFVGWIAQYEPWSHTIFVDPCRAGRQNLDAVKVILAHELVHVGQFRAHPDLFQQIRELRVSAPKTRATLAEAQRVMTHIEGYAEYIQTDFIQRHYSLATFFSSSTRLGRALGEALARIPGLPKPSAMKQAQYENGRTHYRSQQSGVGAAPFVPPIVRITRS